MSATRTVAAEVEPLLNRGQVCKWLGISRATSYVWERAGFLPPPLRLAPGISRWRRSQIEAFLARAAADRGVRP